MKKVISLVMVLCMLLCTLAFNVSADDAAITVAVGSVKDGDVYAEGASIVLTATTNAGNVSHIDFKANGDKIPGTLIDGEGSLVWQPSAAGNYDITAELYCEDNPEAVATSAAVSVRVDRTDYVNALEMNSPEDVKKWTWGGGYAAHSNVTDAYVSDDFTADSAYSLYIDNFYNKSFIYTPEEGSMIVPNLSGDANRHYIKIPIYNASETAVPACNIYVTVKRTNGNVVVSRNNANDDKGLLNPGWNLEKVWLDYGNGGEVTEIHINTRTEHNCNGIYTEANKPNYENAKLYVTGAYFMTSTDNSASHALNVTSTSIPEGKTNVCNELKNYTIKFDRALATVPADAVTVMNTTDNAPVDFTLNSDADYIKLNFADGAFAMGKDYAVKVLSGKVYSDIGYTLAADAEYTFSTIENSCTAAEPIPSVTYPAAGQTVSGNTNLAAKVIFSGNVNKVEFYDGDTLLGEGTKYTGNEYVLDPETALTEGSHSITVKAITASNEYTSDAITVTTGAAGSYKFYGIADGERVLINDRTSRKVYVVDDTVTTTNQRGLLTVPDPTNVSKVEFSLNGGEKTYVATQADGFAWEMPFVKLGTNTLDVTITDVYGDISKLEQIEFKTIYGEALDHKFEDFTNPEVTADGYWYGGTAGKESITNADGVLIARQVESSKGFAVAPLSTLSIPTTSENSNSQRFARWEFDLTKTSGSAYLNMSIYDSVTARTNYGDVIVFHHSVTNLYKTGQKYHITIDCDLQSGLYVAYIDGVEYHRAKTSRLSAMQGRNSLTLAFYLHTYTSSSVGFDIDNVSQTSYGVTDRAYLSKEDSTVTCINPTVATSNVEFDVINAGYTDATKTKLVGATKESVTVEPGKIFNVTYPSISENSRVFVWDKYLTPVIK